MSAYVTGGQSSELDIREGGDSNGGLFPSFHPELNGPKIPQKTLQDTAQKIHALAIERVRDLASKCSTSHMPFSDF